MHFLSLTQCAEEIGMTRAGIYKKLKKDKFPIEYDDNKEIQVNASMFHGKYQQEIARAKGNVSGNVSKNDNGNNGKQQEIEVNAQLLEAEREVRRQLEQRLEEERQNRAREVELMSQQIRLLTDQSGKMPQEVVEKIARLEAERELKEKALEAERKEKERAAKEIADLKLALQTRPDIAQDEITELKRKAKLVDDQAAFNEMRDKILAEYNALPYLKRILTPKPTKQDVLAAIKQSGVGQGGTLENNNSKPKQEKTA